MNLDLNDTLVFVRVVQDGGFSAAARGLQLPKTTVSRRVQELEARLGVQLLHRTTRRIGLTEAGALYFEHCKEIASRLDDAESAVSQLSNGPRGLLRVTLPYSFGVTWIAPLIPGFRALYPDVKLELIASHETLDLVSNELDVALRLGQLPDSDLVVRRLGSFATGVYAATTYLQQHGTPQHPAELKAHRALALHQARTETGYAWPLRGPDGDVKRYGIEPVAIASDPALLGAALTSGEGILLAMNASMEPGLGEGRLQRILPQWSGPEQEFNALYLRGRVPSPKVKAFVDYVKARLVPQSGKAV